MERLLVGLGLALVAFGALILLRFPTRPGGKVRLLGMEVSSVGAGLPLVALGVLMALVVGLNQGEGDSGSDGGGSGAAARPPPENAPACTAAFLASPPEVPRDRQRSLDEGNEDVDVLAATERKRDEFGLFLVDGGEVVGVMKLAYDVDAKQFRVDGVVDSECRPIEWTSDDIPGLNPKTLADHATVRVNTSGARYFLEFKSGIPEVEMELHRSGD